MTKTFLATVAIAVLLFAAAPAHAQRHRGGTVVVAPRIVTPSPLRLYAPYTFQRRVLIHRGLWINYPFVNPYFYSYDSPYYAYPVYPVYPYPYPYIPYSPYTVYSPYPVYPTYPTSVYVPPAQPPASVGGVTFEFTPPTAEVFVDGSRVGAVSDFPTALPLRLAPGKHQIEIRAPGFQSRVIDADVVAGRVIPYRGALQP